MHARVDDEPAGAPHLVGEAAEALVWRVVDAHLDAEVLGIEAPALAECVRVEIAAERRHVFELARERALGVMARRRLVQRQRRQHVERPVLQRIGVDPVLPGRAERARVVAAARVVRRERRRNGLHGVGCARNAAEEVRHAPVDLARDPGGMPEQLLRRRRVELRVGAQEHEELREAALEADLANDRLHLAADARDLREAGLVDLLRRRTRAAS